MKKLLLAAALALVVSPVSAQNYFGISHKMVEADFKDLGVTLDMTGSSMTFGRQINERLKAEIGLTTYVDYKLEGVSAEITSTDLNLLYHPTGNSFYVKGGLTMGEASLDGTGDPNLDGDVDDGPFYYGLGVDLDVGKSSTLRLDYSTATYSDAGDVDISGLTISVFTKF